ncbi:MAG: fimbrillin family protein [Bacteroidales bacterium]|nr:fimbrillin family protein [Bacteroidales bacterium]
MSLALAVLVAVGCTRESVPDTQTVRQVPITFNIINSSHLPITKAPVNSDVNGLLDSALSGIQLLRTDAAATPDWSGTPSPIPASVDTLGQVTPSPAQLYNINNILKSFFKAYYPAATSLSAGVVSWIITGQEDILSSATADAGSINNRQTVLLALSHKLAQLQFEVRATDSSAVASWGTLTYIKISTPTALKLTLSNDSLSSSAVPVVSDLPTSIGLQAGLLLTTSFNSAGVIMVPPATISSIKVKTSLSEETEVLLNIPLSALAGSAHNIQLTFYNFNNPGGIEFTATYTSWQTALSSYSADVY